MGPPVTGYNPQADAWGWEKRWRPSPTRKGGGCWVNNDPDNLLHVHRLSVVKILKMVRCQQSILRDSRKNSNQVAALLSKLYDRQSSLPIPDHEHL
jgi:hypothetical protein